MDPGSILWRAFFFFLFPSFFPLFLSASFKSWHGFNPYKIPIFFPITLFLSSLLFSFFCTSFFSFFLSSLLSSSPFPPPSFLFSFSYFSHSFANKEVVAVLSGTTTTVEYRVSARHRVSAHPIIFSLEGNSSLLCAISGKRPPIDFSG